MYMKIFSMNCTQLCNSATNKVIITQPNNFLSNVKIQTTLISLNLSKRYWLSAIVSKRVKTRREDDASIVWRLNCIHKWFRRSRWYCRAGNQLRATLSSSRARSLRKNTGYCESLRLHSRFFSDRHSAENSSGHRATKYDYGFSRGLVSWWCKHNVYHVIARDFYVVVSFIARTFANLLTTGLL